jgi:hypothetical protein
MELLDKYMDLKKQIFDYFGYVEDWCVFPIVDTTESYWTINGSDTCGSVTFADTVEQFESDGDYYMEDIYTQRFLNKWVYRAPEYTMILVATGCDGNTFLRIFDNEKEFV